MKKIPSVEFLLDREESFVIVFSISLSFLLIIVTERGTITYCWRNLFWIDLSVGSRNLIIDKRCEIIMICRGNSEKAKKISLSREVKEGKKVVRERIKRTKRVAKRVVKCNLKKEETSSISTLEERREKKKAESSGWFIIQPA